MDAGGVRCTKHLEQFRCEYFWEELEGRFSK